MNSASKMKKNVSYLPISCSYYDELEALATLRKKCLIVYKNEAGEQQETTAVIKDFYIQDKVEYMLLSDGRQVRLDHIIQVDGKPLPDSAC